jgi:ribonuclease VapC
MTVAGCRPDGLDTSAIIATITNEQDSSRFREAMLGAENLSISSVTVLETRIVLFARLGLMRWVFSRNCWIMLGLSWCPSTTRCAAFDALRRFGKGQRHPAQLNIADCAVYALAKARSQSLLFKGGDFDRTDIRSALD